MSPEPSPEPDEYGGGLAAAAEGCFEMLYGCDPLTFVRHVANNMKASEPAGRVDV